MEWWNPWDRLSRMQRMTEQVSAFLKTLSLDQDQDWGGDLLNWPGHLCRQKPPGCSQFKGAAHLSPRPGKRRFLLITSVWRLLGGSHHGSWVGKWNKKHPDGTGRRKSVFACRWNDQVQTAQQWTAHNLPPRETQLPLEPRVSPELGGGRGMGWWGDEGPAELRLGFTASSTPLGRPEGHQMKKSYQDWLTDSLQMDR